eukprot:5575552-Prymnesium_polylepis.2
MAERLRFACEMRSDSQWHDRPSQLLTACCASVRDGLYIFVAAMCVYRSCRPARARVALSLVHLTGAEAQRRVHQCNRGGERAVRNKVSMSYS